MSAKRKKSEAPQEVVAADEPRELVRPWLLAGLTAVCVARPLVPSEGVAWLGDGHGLTLALLLLAAVAMFIAGRRRALWRQFDLVDGAVAALVLACITSALLGVIASRYGSSNILEFDSRRATPRFAVNMIWEWVGMGLIYFLARQLVTTRIEARGLLAVMVGLATVISAFGIYQVQVSLPAERAAYAEDPDAVLQAVGQWYPPDSPERLRFEARLASTEPLATFALTNSLAGFLVAWLIVALGVTWRIVEKYRPSPAAMARAFGLIVALGVILVCLLLTRSRSAYVALVCGLVLLPLVAHAWRRSLPWKYLGIAGAGLLVVVAGVVLIAGFDETLVDQAGKSLGYRLEYWDSTLNMIADFPLFGVGPGEFQHYYTQYKLPQASEEISDPHNFVLEAWATGGTATLLALVGLLAAFAWKTWDVSEDQGADKDDNRLATRDSIRVMLVGAAAGAPLAYVLGLPFGFYLSPSQIVAALFIGGGVVTLFWPWVHGGSLPVRLPALGVLVLTIHWLASGGFAFPGVADTFWLLIALGVNQRSDRLEAAKNVTYGWRSLVLPIGLSLPVLVAAVGCYYSGFLPVLACRAAMGLASDARMADETRFTAILGGIEADRMSAEPWMASAQLAAQRLAENPKSKLWDERLYPSAAWVEVLQGHSSAAARQLSQLFRQVYEASPVDARKKPGERMVYYARLAALWYPNSPVVQGEYALALETTGSPNTARRIAQRALELDELTPHDDKKLSHEMRQRLKKLIASAQPADATPEPSQPVE